jgi:UPF0271 protein
MPAAVKEIDLNCDLGEGGSHDEELLALISTANVACGFHAGDPVTALATLRAAARHGVRVGAHPGYADRDHFGRRELDHDPERVFAECVYQIGALAGLADAAGLALAHVKPHGGLYHQACGTDSFARPVVEAAALFGLPVMGLPGSRLEAACAGRVAFIPEGFADRRYQADGTLVPRTQPGAFVADPAEAVRQLDGLLRERGVRTVCVHGDNPEALAFVRALRAALVDQGYTIRSFP